MTGMAGTSVLPELDLQTGLPKAQGLYDPQQEKDACGVGFIVNIHGIKSKKILEDASVMLCRMKHRGACSGDNNTGDGAGVMTAIPHQLYARVLREEQGIYLPGPKHYATGVIFLDKETAPQCEQLFDEIAAKCKLNVLCWRTVPHDSSVIGAISKSREPFIRQVFVTGETEGDKLKRQVFALRKEATHTIPNQGYRFYICNLSVDTIVYKSQTVKNSILFPCHAFYTC